VVSLLRFFRGPPPLTSLDVVPLGHDPLVVRSSALSDDDLFKKARLDGQQ
jgi:hypothetical protein